MSQNPRLRPDSSKAASPWDEKPADHATAFFSGQPRSVTNVAQTLAAHGGGAASVGLAFDLVMNDLVEQAREATGATGAAIALMRDGEMVCRATTGESAPDLGVRVDTASGLAGACMSSGQIQQCRDTETDARVNAEACRRLGVRSMLIAPLIDASTGTVDAATVFGILQVFSAWPNAFGEREVSELQSVAGRIIESKRESETDVVLAPRAQDEPVARPRAAAQNVGAPLEPVINPAQDFSPSVPPVDEEPPKRHETWSALLVLLVIGAAILFGWAVGWHGGSTLRVGSQAAAPAASTTNPAAAPAAQPESPTAPSDAPAISNTSSTPAAGTPAASQVPTGGLVVTENGKVIYRSPVPSGAAPNRTPQRQSNTRPIHRVQPEYPQQARDQKIQGSVVLVVKIEGDGSVGDVGVASGDAVLAQAAVQAVKQWRYEPYSVDGRAVERQARITVRFTLPPS